MKRKRENFIFRAFCFNLKEKEKEKEKPHKIKFI